MSTNISLVLPCQGRITQTFGKNVEYYKQWGYCCGHNGIDFGIANGTKILAAADGEINYIGFEQGGYGNYIRMAHDGFLTYYAHLQKAILKVGVQAKAGELIALSNNTGASTGPHLHFGLKIPGSNPGMKGYIDPAAYFGLSPHDPPLKGQRVLTINFGVEVVVSQLRVRDGAGIQYKHVGNVSYGDMIECSAVTFYVINCKQEAWYRHADGMYKGMWSAGIYLDETYLKQVK